MVILPRPRRNECATKEAEETGTLFRLRRYLSLQFLQRLGVEGWWGGGVGSAVGVWEDNADREKTERSTLKVRARA